MVKFMEEEKILQFLMGSDDHAGLTVRHQVLVLDSLPLSDKIYNMV